MVNLVYSQDEYQVWLDTEVCVRDGTCIGSGDTVSDAVQQATRHLAESILEANKLVASDAQKLD